MRIGLPREELLKRRYPIVANSRDITKSGAFPPSERLALVDGNVGTPLAPAKIADVATSGLASIDLGHVAIADGTSELMPEVFGAAKTWRRFIAGVASLPLGVPMELEVIFRSTTTERTNLAVGGVKKWQKIRN
jgi:hypothetical protein